MPVTRALPLLLSLLAACAPSDPTWLEPIRLHVAGGVPAPVAAEARATLKSLAGEAGVGVREVDAATASVVMRAGAFCWTALEWDGGTLIRAEVSLLTTGPRVRRCVHHELMHVMGLRAHPPGTASVLSYDPAAPHEITHQDRASVRRLYRRR